MVAKALTAPSRRHREREPLRQSSRAQRIGATLVEAPVVAGERKLMTEVAAEVMAGLAHDRTFGPVVMFGLGGIFVEVLNDVAFCVVPLRPRDARAMIREVRGFPHIAGLPRCTTGRSRCAGGHLVKALVPG